MPKRTNPTSLRIGSQYHWKHSTQNYNLNRSYTTFFSLFFLKNLSFLTQTLHKPNVGYLESITLKTLRTKSLISLVLFSQTKNLHTKIHQSQTFVYFNFTPLSSAALISQYSFCLFSSTQLSLKKLISVLNSVLATKLGFSKIVKTKFGLKSVSLQGFKLEISGRFEASSSQMAKKSSQMVGILPLMTLKYYIEFASTPLFFKLGSCNLKVWLFYVEVLNYK